MLPASGVVMALGTDGSAEDATRVRLCFVPQQQRSCALPPLFRARLSGAAQQVQEHEMWQLTLEVRSPSILGALLYCMRYAFESVWRCLGSAA